MHAKRLPSKVQEWHATSQLSTLLTKRKKNAGNHIALLTVQKEQHSITVKISFFITFSPFNLN
jgi:hypothetical protein